MDYLSQVPTMLVSTAKSIIARLTATDSTPLLPFIPKYIKVLFLLVVLANSSSFPFAWHLRVWYYPLREYYLAYSKGYKTYWLNWKRDNKAAGGIFGLRVRNTRRVLFDDCDYNMHLSNSCYAKNSDASKMKFAMDALAPSFGCGLYMAMGASHWKYLKEIPLGSEYVMETRMGGWGEKWVYLVTEFIIYPKKGSKRGSSKSRAEPISSSVVPSISVPPSGTTTPALGDKSPSPGTPDEVVRQLNSRAREPRPDGGIVCCINVTDYCFKMGRVTVPPRIIMHLSFQSPTEKGQAHALQVLSEKDRGRAYCRGGWKDDVDADSVGRDIGLAEDGSDAWIIRGREAMESVTEGLSIF